MVSNSFIVQQSYQQAQQVRTYQLCFQYSDCSPFAIKQNINQVLYQNAKPKKHNMLSKSNNNQNYFEIIDWSNIIREDGFGWQYPSILQMINNQENSLRLSTRLKTIRQRIIDTQDNEVITQMFHLKNINNQQGKSAITSMIAKLRKIFKCLRQIEDQRSIKYNSQNQQHQQSLLALWKTLKPDQKLTSRFSRQWIDIGFQDQDPSSDFRGAGYLGLINLLNYSKSSSGMQCFRTATQKQTQFFFCSAGLFMTMLTLELCKTRKVDQLFINSQNSLAVFQDLYDHAFNAFHSYWLQCQDKSMMSFNMTIKKFGATFKDQVSSKILPNILKQKTDK